VIPLAADPAAQAAPPEHDALVVGAAANLEPWKGLDVLVEAARRAQAPVRLEIFGDGTERQALERQAREAEVDARFHGFVPDLPERLGGLDVLAQPSRADNLPVAVLEAMAAGLPVVGTRAGGIPELVLDRETGLLVDPEDPAGLASALDTLAADPELRRRLGHAARARASAEFSPEALARRTISLYEELCGSST
jgi:glycosyltransferase involved in cell wall biosynthesis